MARSKKAQGTALEKKLLEILRSVGINANPTGNSGAIREDGDIHVRDYAFDCKSQHELEGKYVVNPKIDSKDFEKIKHQAASIGKTPVLVMDNSKGEVWVAMDVYDWVQLLMKAIQGESCG